MNINVFFRNMEEHLQLETGPVGMQELHIHSYH